MVAFSFSCFLLHCWYDFVLPRALPSLYFFFFFGSDWRRVRTSEERRKTKPTRSIEQRDSLVASSRTALMCGLHCWSLWTAPGFEPLSSDTSQLTLTQESFHFPCSLHFSSDSYFKSAEVVHDLWILGESQMVSIFSLRVRIAAFQFYSQLHIQMDLE